LHAKVILSALPITYEDAVLESLDQYHHEITDGIAKTMKIRRIPKIHWEFDHTEENAASLEKLMDDISSCNI